MSDEKPFGRTVIMDFNEIANLTIETLEDNGYLASHIDFLPIMEHVCDLVVLGSVYEQYTGDAFKEALEYQNVPTEIYTQLSRELRARISSKFVEVCDFFNDRVHFNITWQKNDLVATVQVFHIREDNLYTTEEQYNEF